MSKNSGVAAIVVTYNPSEEVVRNIALIASQVDLVLVYDNSSESLWQKNETQSNSEVNPFRKIIDLNEENPSIRIFRNGENIGLPRNYNMGIKTAKRQGMNWVVLFDQDSTPIEGAINELLSQYHRLSKGYQIGAIGSTNVEHPLNAEITSSTRLRAKGKDFLEDEDVVEVLVKENSGLLLEIERVMSIGLFSEDFFLDGTDYDLCMRLRCKGYRIFQSKKSVMVQKAGTAFEQNFLGRRVTIHYRGPERTFYISESYSKLLQRYWKCSTKFALKIIFDLTLLAASICLVYKNKKLHISKGIKGLLKGLSDLDLKI